MGLELFKTRRFLPLFITQFMGAFNDNFFKQAACLLAIASGRAELQGYAGGLFALPFILFAAPAGFFADRFAKRNVVIAAKTLELAAMICGAIGMCIGNWPLILIMVFTMGALLNGPTTFGDCGGSLRNVGKKAWTWPAVAAPKESMAVTR